MCGWDRVVPDPAATRELVEVLAWICGLVQVGADQEAQKQGDGHWAESKKRAGLEIVSWPIVP